MFLYIADKQPTSTAPGHVITVSGVTFVCVGERFGLPVFADDAYSFTSGGTRQANTIFHTVTSCINTLHSTNGHTTRDTTHSSTINVLAGCYPPPFPYLKHS